MKKAFVVGALACMYFNRVILLNILVVFFEASFIKEPIHLDHKLSFQNISCSELSGCHSWLYWVRFQVAKYTESFLKTEVPEGHVNEYLSDTIDKDFSAPFVIRNAANRMAKKWMGRENNSYEKAFKYLTKRFGDKRVLVAKNRSLGQTYDSFDMYETVLKRYIKHMENNASFVDYVNLIDSFSEEYIHEMYPYLKHINRKQIITSQMFLGPNGTSSSYHSALMDNMFVQVFGTKKWCFIEPQYWIYMRHVLYLKTRNMVSNIPSVHLKLIPRKCFFLKAGDILFNPSYMWHSVENIDRLNLGFANRLTTHKFNFVYDTLHWKNIYEVNMYNILGLKIGENILAGLGCIDRDDCYVDVLD